MLISVFVYELVLFTICFFFFKQKTAYEMRISDWSSDVCSSDLFYFLYHWRRMGFPGQHIGNRALRGIAITHCACRRTTAFILYANIWLRREIGRASCRERVCKYV